MIEGLSPASRVAVVTEATQQQLQARVLARMEELTDPSSRWQRALWTVACVTTLDELVEAAFSTWNGTLSTEHALNDVRSDAVRIVSTDPGIGEDPLRAQILVDIKKMKADDTPESRNACGRVEQWRNRIARDYLRNWASFVDDENLSEAAVELAARSIVTHLRSLGYSRTHLRGWIADRGSTLGVAGLAREAARNLQGTPRTYTFVVASTHLGRAARWENALSAALYSDVQRDFEGAENAREFDLTTIVDTRTITLDIVAADPSAALNLLQLRIDRMLTRAALAAGQIQRPVNRIVLERSANKLWKLPDPERLVSIPALKDRKLITSLEGGELNESLTETLHLLTPHLQATHGVSLATLWASAEALLGRTQQGGHLVAHRAAAIITGAYPRTLADDLYRRVKKLRKDGMQFSCRTDSFAAFVEDLSLHDLEFTDLTDAAAYYRYRAVLEDPRAVLKRVRQYLTTLFLRVYYHRNFVMHAGKTSNVSLEAVSGLAPSLVAAGVNEMVRGLARGITPHALADRAFIELDLLGTDASRPVTNLLG